MSDHSCTVSTQRDAADLRLSKAVYVITHSDLGSLRLRIRSEKLFLHGIYGVLIRYDHSVKDFRTQQIMRLLPATMR